MAQLVPVPSDFEGSVAHPLSRAGEMRDYLAEAVGRGITRVVLIGCGGSHFGAYPSCDLLDRRSRRFAVSHLTSAELTARQPVWLDSGCLVVAASHSGNTPETVAAAEYAKSRGCATIGLSRFGDNGLSRTCDLHLDYPDTITITEPKLIHTMLLATELLRLEGQTETAAMLQDGLAAMPGALRAAKDEIAEVADQIGQLSTTNDPIHYVGAGPAFGQAKMMAWCYSMEMLWAPATAINGADFFHGPLELTLANTPMVVLLAEDPTRPLGERVVSFARRYTERLAVIDSASLSMHGVSATARSELSVLAMISASRRVLDHVAAQRDHDTSVRRYMYQVAY